MKMQGMFDMLIFICGFVITVVNAQDCRSGLSYDSVNANKGTFMTDHWYLNTEESCTCSGRVDKYEVKYYSLVQNGQHSVYAAIWKPVGGDIYELDSSSITEVTESNDKRRKKRSNLDGTIAVNPSSLYIRKGAIIGVYFNSSITNNLPVLGSINGNHHLCTGASTSVFDITTIDCSVQSTEGTNKIIHVEAQIVRIECDQNDIPRINHGSSSLRDDDTEYMARVQYTCDIGYKITNGDEYLYCNENKQWSGTVPTCTVISCPPVANSLNHGTVNVLDNLLGNSNYMSVVMFSCNIGYQLNGASSITCQANGEWSGVIPTECTPDTTTVGSESTVNSMPSVTTATLSSVTVSDSVSIVTTFTTQSLTTFQVIPTFIHNSISTTAVLTVSSGTSTLAVGYGSNSVSQFISIDHVTPRSFTPSETHLTSSDLPPGPSVFTKSLTAAVQHTHIYHQSLTNSITSHQLSSTIQHDASPSQTRAADASSARSDVESSIGIAVGIIVIVIVGLVAVIIVLVLLYKKRIKTLHKIANNDSTWTKPPPGLTNCNYDNVTNTLTSPSAGLINYNYDEVTFTINKQPAAIPAINTISNPEYTGNVPHVTYEPVDGCRSNTLAMENASMYSELENKQSPPPYPAPAKSALSDELSVGGVNGVYEVLDSNSDQYFELGDGVFTEEPTYWEPASNTKTLYDQLARRKYRRIPRENITVTDHLGSGQFGSVEKGTWQTQNGIIEVAIKTLKGVASDEDELKFLQEAAINGQFHHPNVVQLCGVVTVGKPILIVLEYIPNGNLKGFLEEKRPLSSGGMCDEQLPSLLIKFSYQIASGMLYLSNKRFIHRDLAARNILVGNNNICKIADFGMSRDLQDESYYQSNSKRIPVKWTAPEALNYRKYTTQSDVWSYGALLYEIWSVGYKPFQQYTNQECIKLVDSGYRLASPPGCPRTVYSMMIDCWNPSAKKRPTFQYLMSTFQSAMVNGIYEEAMQLKTALGCPLNDDRSQYPDLQNKYA